MTSNVDATIGRGSTNGANNLFGRGNGYRNGGEQTNSNGNTGVSQPFPGTVGNENGGLDNGGSGNVIRRVYGFNSHVGSTRPAPNPDEPSQPWDANGATGAGSPVANGQFSPWANLYRVWVDIENFQWPGPGPGYNLALSASAFLSGTSREWSNRLPLPDVSRGNCLAGQYAPQALSVSHRLACRRR